MAYKIVQFILGIILRPLFLFEIRGQENIPEYDGYILCANHKSNWDPIFLAISIDNPINFMAKKELFENPILAWLLAGFGVFPIDREGRDLKTIKDSVKRLDNGAILGIMPEGTRTKTTARENMKEGVAYIALKAHANILPVEIVSKFRPFSKTYIYIKEPIDIGNYKEMKSKEAMIKITDRLYYDIYEHQLPIESSNYGN